MNENPILYSTSMVQANTEGRKTMTRRMTGLGKINADPDRFEFIRIQLYNNCCKAVFRDKISGDTHLIKCPYGDEFDLLWVRESFAPIDHPELKYRYKADHLNLKSVSWKPSIHMPKSAARIWAEVEEIRVERLNEISEEDAIAEGVLSKKIQNCFWYDDYLQPNTFPHANPIDSFKSLFLSINGKPTPQREFGEKGKIVLYTAIAWDQEDFDINWAKYHGEYRQRRLHVVINPWVWVVKYKVLSTTGKPENV
jgi:hypothetical protein